MDAHAPFDILADKHWRNIRLSRPRQGEWCVRNRYAALNMKPKASRHLEAMPYVCPEPAAPSPNAHPFH